MEKHRQAFDEPPARIQDLNRCHNLVIPARQGKQFLVSIRKLYVKSDGVHGQYLSRRRAGAMPVSRQLCARTTVQAKTEDADKVAANTSTAGFSGSITSPGMGQKQQTPPDAAETLSPHRKEYLHRERRALTTQKCSPPGTPCCRYLRKCAARGLRSSETLATGTRASCPRPSVSRCCPEPP